MSVCTGMSVLTNLIMHSEMEKMNWMGCGTFPSYQITLAWTRMRTRMTQTQGRWTQPWGPPSLTPISPSLTPWCLMISWSHRSPRWGIIRILVKTIPIKIVKTPKQIINQKVYINDNSTFIWKSDIYVIPCNKMSRKRSISSQNNTDMVITYSKIQFNQS